MDVSVGVFWGINLKNPVDIREIKTSCGDVSAEKNSVFLFTEGEVDSHSFLLFLVALKFIEGRSKFEFSECFIQEANLFAGGQEYDYFLFGVALEERVKSVDFFLRVNHHVVLDQF